MDTSESLKESNWKVLCHFSMCHSVTFKLSFISVNLSNSCLIIKWVKSFNVKRKKNNYRIWNFNSTIDSEHDLLLSCSLGVFGSELYGCANYSVVHAKR